MKGNKLLTLLFSLFLVFGLGLVNSNYVYAADEYEIGTSNLNGTEENSAKVGDSLEHPEKGWKRYDDKNSNIMYSGEGWYEGGNTNTYKGSLHASNKKAEVKFNFKGTKLRLLSNCFKQTGFSDNIVVYIDGNKIDTYSENINERNLGQVILYENNNLKNKEHFVKIEKDNDGKYIELDAIDIDEDGKLLPYNEVINSDLVELDKTKISLKEGELSKLTATTTPAAVQIKWSSSDESIATVGQNGKVTGVKEGKCTITAQIEGSDAKATCEVTVTKEDVIVPEVPTDTDDFTENIINIAHAKGSNTNNASGECTIIFHGTADTTLQVVKTADVKEVWVGDTFYYTITVTNTGSKTAKAVVINDDAPNHIEFKIDGVTTTQGEVDSSSTSKNLIVNVGDIEPSQTVTIKIPVNVVA